MIHVFPCYHLKNARKQQLNANVQMLGECRALLVISGPGGGELRAPEEIRTRLMESD